MSDAGAFGWVEPELAAIRRAGLERRLLQLDGPPSPTVAAGGRAYLLLGSNNYLDLAAHPAVTEAAAAAARAHGAGAGASRLVSGASAPLRELETELAEFLEAEDALLFSSGYLANTGVIPALVGEGDEVFSDELNHASVIDGCRWSRARVSVYPHGDMEALEARLRASAAARRLIISDSVFSMDGDRADVAALAGLARAAGAMLLLDESHAFGVLGPDGRGLAAAAGAPALVMATLSKALGSAGGFVAGPASLMHYLRHRARSFVFDTAPAPPAVGAALAALRVMRAEPARRARLLDLTARLRQRLSAGGLRVREGDTPVVPLHVGEAEAALALAAAAREKGVIVFPIRPPSVAPGTSRIRLTVSSGFSEAQVDRAVEVLLEAAAAVG